MRAKKTKPRSSSAAKQQLGAGRARGEAAPPRNEQRVKDEPRTAQRNSTKRPKRPQTAAERHGLTERNDVISETPKGLHPQNTVANIIDQQFTLWLALLNMTPLPIILRQQAEIARLITDAWLPTKSERN